MKIAGKDRCINCFKPLEDKSGVCLCCSFVEKDYVIPKRALRPGTLLEGRYYIGRVLGAGGFGITYVAWDNLLEIKVAIKEYYSEDHDQKDKNNALRETRIMSKFTDLPGIVVARDYFEANDTAYLIMEYVNGIRISDYIKKNGPMNIAMVLERIEPVIRSLASIHESGYLHKDISANNIMITGEGKFVLIDFGTARTIERSDLTTTVAVKMGYSPIEQYKITGKTGPWTDIYSLCATIYYMVTGVIPVESIERVIADKVEPLEKNDTIFIDQNIKRAIDKGMSVLAADRYKNVGELYEELYPGKHLSDIKIIDITKDDMLLLNNENNTRSSGTFSETSLRQAFDRLFARDEQLQKEKKYRKLISVCIWLGIMTVLITFLYMTSRSDKAIEYDEITGNNTVIANEQASDNVMEEGNGGGVVAGSKDMSRDDASTDSEGLDYPEESEPTSTPEAFAVVPKLTGKLYKNAKKELEEAGFVVKKKSKYSEKKKNTVINQSVAHSTKVVYGSVIELTVSKGEKKQPVQTQTPKPEVRTQVTAKPQTNSRNTHSNNNHKQDKKDKTKTDDSAGALN